MVRVHKQKGVANHCCPESCVDLPQGRWRSVDRGCVGWAIELRNHPLGMPTMLNGWEGNMLECDTRECSSNPPESENHSIHINLIHGNREACHPARVRVRNAVGQNLTMYGRRESDQCVVPEKRANKVATTGYTLSCRMCRTSPL